MPKVILYSKVGALPNMKAALILALITVHASIGLAENLGTKPQIKNVVLIVSDDLKASVLGCRLPILMRLLDPEQSFNEPIAKARGAPHPGSPLCTVGTKTEVKSI